MEVIFILSICKIWFGHIILSLKFEYDPKSGCWDISVLLFWGLLGCSHDGNWPSPKIWSWVAGNLSIFSSRKLSLPFSDCICLDQADQCGQKCLLLIWIFNILVMVAFHSNLFFCNAHFPNYDTIITLDMIEIVQDTKQYLIVLFLQPWLWLT